MGAWRRRREFRTFNVIDDFNLYAYVKNDPLNSVDPTGMVEDSEANKEKRAALAQNAAKMDGSKAYAFSAKTDDTPANQNKCSEFVNDLAEEAGMPMSVPVRENGEKVAERRPTAGEMANRKGDEVKNWRRMGSDEKPLPGDAAAYKIPGGGVGATGHSGIIIAGPEGKGVSNISAHDSGVYTTPDQFGEVSGTVSGVVYLRYTGD